MSLKKRSLGLLLSIVLLLSIFPLSSAPVSGAYTGVLEFDEAGKFTVMQITDIQDGSTIDARVIAMITKAIARYNPDLVVFTGDNTRGGMWPSTLKKSIDQFLAPLLNTNTKFAVTFGNHDEDGTWPFKMNRSDQYDYYKSKGGSNFIDHDVPALDGVGSGVIPIFPQGQTSGTPAFQLYLMDSHSYASGGYDCPRTNQIDYYIQRSLQYPDVPSLWYMHIIVPDVYWETMIQVPSGTPNSYKGNGSPFSSNTWALDPDLIDWSKSGGTTIAEIYKEPPCPANESVYISDSRRSSAQYGKKTLYEAWVAYGNMLGSYYGHDHKNTFVTTTQHGIDIGYAKGATLKSYNDGNPGLRVFELDVNGTYVTQSVTESDLAKSLVKFNPNGGEGAMTGQVIAKNATAALKSNAFIRDGYEFIGWSTSSNGAVVYSDMALFTAGTADTTLYAQWQASVFSAITFDANGGIGGIGPMLMRPGDPLSAPAVSRTGFVFEGWMPEVPQTVPAGDETYTAVWTTIHPVLNASGETETIVDQASGLIFGLPPGTLQLEFENNLVTVGGSGHLVITPTVSGFGTGTKVELVNNYDGTVSAVYYILIFGDVNGDGGIDGNDSGIITNYMNWLFDWDPELKSLFMEAADLNGDGVLDGVDADILMEVENWNMRVDQITGLAVPY